MSPESIQVASDGDRSSPRPRSPAAKLVLRELLEADTELAVQELQERTLLPEAPVRETLSDLAAAGLCTIERTSDCQPRHYVAVLASDSDS